MLIDVLRDTREIDVHLIESKQFAEIESTSENKNL